MKKVIAGFLCAVCAFALTAADLEKYIDASAKVAVIVDIEKILENKDVLAAIEQQGKDELARSVFNNPKYKLSDYFDDALCTLDYENKQFGIFVKVDHFTPAMLQQQLDKMGVQYKKEKINGLDVYAIDDANPAMQVLIAMPEKDLCIAASRNLFTGITSGKYAKGEKLTKLLKTTDDKASFRAAALIPPMSGNDPQSQQFPKLESATFSMKVTGADASGVNMEAAATAINEQEAAKAQMLSQQLLLFASMAMSEKPELFEELAKAIKIERKGNAVLIHVDIDGALAKKLSAFAQEMQAKRASAAAPAAPVATPVKK